MTDFSSKEMTFADFISKINTIYHIPPYQRDYSWKEVQWEDLWNDIWGLSEYAEDPESSHYLGYIVIKKNNITNDSKEAKQISRYDIIDGQQRMTTLSLFTLAAIKILEERQAKTPADILRDRYIGMIDTVTGGSKVKLKLNKNNQAYYTARLSSFKDWKIVLPDNPSNKLLLKGFQFFKKKIEKELDLKNTVNLVTFVELSLQNIVFTEMSVADEVKAYKLFETLNARGVQLSSIDLLKNYLFLTAGDVYSEQMSEAWDILSGTIGKDGELKDFVRYYWNSQYKYTKKNSLFKAIKEEIKTDESAFEFVTALQNTAYLFSLIKNPIASEWHDDMECVKRLKEFNSFGAVQPNPFLFALERVFGRKKEFKTIVHLVNTLTFKHSKIGDKNPNELEAFYADLCEKLNKSTPPSLEELQGCFVDKMPSDESFKSALQEKEFNSSEGKKLAKYILAEIEFHKSKTRIDLTSEDVSLDHIEALKSKDGGRQKSKDIHKLGNLCLLNKKDNNETKNTTVAKKQTFQKSSYVLTQSVFKEDSTDWNDETIQARTKELADLAVEIWKV